MGGFPDPDSVCRRHPNHKQLPGVCSFCLREKLSKLTTDDVTDSNYSTACYTSLSSSPPYSSASSFSPALIIIPAEEQQKSPARRPYRRRNGSDEHVAVPLGFLLNGHGNGIEDLGLKKSRSVGCGPRIYKGVNVNGNFNGEDVDGGKKREKVGKKGSVGFWKKLIHSTSKKSKGALMHSSTMKERSNDTNSSSSRRFR